MIMTRPASGAVEGTEFGNFECPAREMFDFIHEAVDANRPAEGEPDPPVTMRDLARPA